MAPLSTISPELAAENQRNLRRLVMSVRASFHKLNLLIAICDNPEYRDELIHSYETELKAQGTECYQVRLDRQQPSLKQSLADLGLQQSIEPTPALVTVLGGDELLAVRLDQPRSAQEQFFFSVQWTREGLREFRFPIVVWVSEAVAQGLAQQAPDFWSWRGGVFEFVQPRTAQPTVKGQDPDRSYEPEALADPAELQQQIATLLAEDPDSPLLESLYQSLGITYYKRLEQGISQDRLQEQQAAIEAFQAAIALREALDDHNPLATSLSHLALLYQSQGKYESAEPLLVQALQINEQQLGANHPNTSNDMNNLGLLYQFQGKYESAEPLLVQALQISEQQLGANHLDTATSLNNLAELYRLQERYDAAEPLYVRALQIREQQLGGDHPYTAISLNNLALLHYTQGRYDAAEPLYVRALQIYEQQLGADHPNNATSLNNLAALYYTQGRYDAAEPLYVRALEISQKYLGENHPNTQAGKRNFRLLLQRAVQAGQAGELSAHPMTQALLQQVKAEEGKTTNESRLSGLGFRKSDRRTSEKKKRKKKI